MATFRPGGIVVDEGPGIIESHGRAPLPEGGPRFIVGIEEFGVGGVSFAQSPPQVAVVEDAGADSVALKAVAELPGDGGLAPGGQSGHNDVEKRLFHSRVFFSVQAVTVYHLRIPTSRERAVSLGGLPPVW